ncbi:MAG TPA: flagellar brake protein [Accumulibacter sp.]|nr:flagellar brake protein [Accumulibacter sp.]
MMEEPGIHGQESQSIHFEIYQPEEYGQYFLHAKVEVLAVLRSLAQKKSLVSAYFNHGRSLLLTSILHVAGETDELIFDIGNDSEINRQVLQATNLVLTAVIDSVKVQFLLHKLTDYRLGSRPVFRASLPDKVLRLQRREFFRLTTPVAKPVKFVSTLRRPDGSVMTVEAPLLDISGGGVGLMATPKLAEMLPRGTLLKESRITLPDEGMLTANLCVCNQIDVTTRSGARHVRVGCEFVGLPGARMSMVQRYITRIERERKARLSGLG